jgi:Cu-processing system permease protein
MTRIFKYILLDLLKNKILLLYTIVLALLAWSVLNLEDNATKGILSLLQVILITVPLVCIIFSTIYIYNSTEFIELLLSQPVQRKNIWVSLFLGLAGVFVLAFIIGVGLPLLLYTPMHIALTLFITGILLSVVFVALAFFSAVFFRDKSKGIGLAILLWLFFALVFDGMVLFLLFQFADYPIEKPMIGIIALCPIDLARIIILLQLDVSAVMGYTGAVFKDVFGTAAGLATAFFILVLWAVIPFYISLRKFKIKNL